MTPGPTSLRLSSLARHLHLGWGEAGGLCCVYHPLFWDSCSSTLASVSSALGWTPGDQGHVRAGWPCLGKVRRVRLTPGSLFLCVSLASCWSLLVPAGPCCSLWSQLHVQNQASRREGRTLHRSLRGPHRAPRSPPGVIQRQACFPCRQLGSVGPRRCPLPAALRSQEHLPGPSHGTTFREPSILSIEVLPFSSGPSVGSKC